MELDQEHTAGAGWFRGVMGADNRWFVETSIAAAPASRRDLPETLGD
jgi:hypothetical protein